ncbi:MAG: isoprenylcysteine carboxylmethyltransferase family protein [Firmicutes bacterium]|nr:isoprenylcysteine carboxylmethyltransferase family protein [Bacillota bacterium]
MWNNASEVIILKLLKAILILPGTVGLLIPFSILTLTGGDFRPHSPTNIMFWLGLGFLVAGISLGIWTVSLFSKLGKGTPAPWEPPRKLVVAGPYRHVRNPMITGMILILSGQAIILGSGALAIWAAVFFIGNAIYFPLAEEKGLKDRFGSDYVEYMDNVPRWLPRLRPWKQSK